MEALLPIIPVKSGITAFNAGYFISRGVGGHPIRVIDSYEIIYVMRGELRMFENDRQFTVPTGSALLLYPGRKHGGVGIYPVGLSFFWVHFGTGMTAAADFAASLPQQQVIAQPERMTSWFRRFLDDQERGIRSELQAELLIWLMLSEFQLTMRPPVTGGGLAEKALEYIKVHFAEPISTATIGSHLHCNPDYLGRVFRTAYDRNITAQLVEERLRYARRQLLESAMNINEVMAACGFSDPAYFRRCFVRESGMTPSRFRRLYGKVYVNTE